MFEGTILDGNRTTLNLFEADLEPSNSSPLEKAVLLSSEVMQDALGVLCWTAAIVCDMPRKLAQEYVSHLQWEGCGRGFYSGFYSQRFLQSQVDVQSEVLTEGVRGLDGGWEVLFKEFLSLGGDGVKDLWKSFLNI